MTKKILIVDDDRVFLKYLSKHLTAAGHTVTKAKDGVSALNILTSFTPDLIFLDLILPKIDGDKLCRIIRKMDHLSNCYLVVISAMVAEISSNVKEIGADSYIAKGPFAEVMKHVTAAIEESNRLTFQQDDIKSTPVRGLKQVSPRQLTRELLSRNQHLKTILESMEEGILEVIDGNVVYANSAAVQLIGKPLENVLAVNPENLFDGHGQMRIVELFKSAESQTIEIGQSRPIELNGHQVSIKFMPVEAQEKRSILLITDISERKRLELQLQHSQKMEAIGTIASGVAHNFRNTLTEILVNSQVIRENYQKDSDIQGIVDRIETSVGRGTQLIKRLMHFARKESKKDFRKFDLISLIAETYQIIRRSISRQIDIQLNIRHSLPVLGDYMGLSQALMNLITNAYDAMPGGGMLRIEAFCMAQTAVMRVSDSGEGMDDEARKRCFDPFFTTKAVGKGTGLGLSTTYSIIRSNGGDVAVVSSSPKGTTFEIRLPLADIGVEKHPQRIVMGAGQSILIVENRPELIATTSDLLECIGYRSERALTVDDAIEKCASLRPEMIIIDASELCKSDFEQLGFVFDDDLNAKIVAMVNFDGDYLTDKCDWLEGIVEGYLEKPLDIPAASQIISEVMAG